MFQAQLEDAVGTMEQANDSLMIEVVREEPGELNHGVGVAD